VAAHEPVLLGSFDQIVEVSAFGALGVEAPA
jgi:hypothetical protein